MNWWDSLETNIKVTLLMLLSGVVAWITKSITGERRAAMRQVEATTARDYGSAASSTLTMYVEMRDKYDSMQKKYDELFCRMDVLEQENAELHKQITVLQFENKNLKDELVKRKVKGLHD